LRHGVYFNNAAFIEVLEDVFCWLSNMVKIELSNKTLIP